MTVAFITVAYIAIGAMWSWALDADRHRYAESITGLDIEQARFECRWGWARDFLLWPLHMLAGCVALVRTAFGGRP